LHPKADINPHSLERPLSAMNGHLAFLNIHRNVAHRDAGGGAVRTGHLTLEISQGDFKVSRSYKFYKY
jgi:hypothetical protein